MNIAQTKLRQLAFLHAKHVDSLGSKIPIDQNKVYEMLNNSYEQGYLSLADINEDIQAYLEMRKQ